MIWGLILSLIKQTFIFDDMTQDKFLFYYWQYTSTYFKTTQVYSQIIHRKISMN